MILNNSTGKRSNAALRAKGRQTMIRNGFVGGYRMLGMILGLAMTFSALGIAGAMAQDGTGGEVIPGQYLVVFEDTGADPSVTAQQLAAAHGVSVRHVYRHALQGMAITVPAAAEAAVVNALSRNPRVRSIGNGHNGGAGVRIAVLDSGLDFLHSDLAGNIDVASSRDFITSSRCSGQVPSGGQDNYFHGTFVGGVIAAIDNGIDVVGAAPNTELVAVKVLNCQGSGSFTEIIAGVDFVAGLAGTADHVDVVNMSLGATCSVCTENSGNSTISAFQDAIEALVDAGVTVVVAAGNDGLDSSTSVPAAFDAVITVSALTDTDGAPGGNGPSLIFPGAGKFNDDTVAKFSNYGADVDVIAPGVNVESLALGGTTRVGSGTSYAAPLAAAVAAIYLSANPGASPAEVRDALIQTGECRDGDDGLTFHEGLGCSQAWPGDRDSFPEPMVRADNVLGVVTPPPPPGNTVPVAQDDDYSVDMNGTLSVPPDGVLTNDSDGDEDPLDASLVTGVANGSLTLNSDGSFDYTPNTDFVGTDSFTYVANDGTDDSNVATVTITVSDPNAVVTVAGCTPASGPAGARMTVRVEGEGFQAGASVSFGSRIAIQSVSFVDSGALDVAIKIHRRASGSRDVTVSNPDGSGATGAGCFSVN
jgi:subtilisin family serine protease